MDPGQDRTGQDRTGQFNTLSLSFSTVLSILDHCRGEGQLINIPLQIVMELATEVKSDLMSLDKAGLVALLPSLLKKPEKGRQEAALWSRQEAALWSRQEAAVRILVTEAARQGTDKQVLIWLIVGRSYSVAQELAAVLEEVGMESAAIKEVREAV